ncbi:MAG: hypothetical protein KGJ55_05350 [Gammaproteobacteria bacterium]|nr:hypothetical protein [Gammaproteobacteria bacterium]
MAFPLTNVYIEQYKTAAAEVALVELKLRLLADKVSELQKYAHQQNFEDVEAAIAQHFGTSLAETDKDKLTICRKLRNKILHCNFSVAREKLGGLGVATQSGGVRKLKLAGLSEEQIAEQLKAASANVPGTFDLVADTKTKDPGSIFGWLLEMGSAGDFQRAADAFKVAAAIVDQLLNVSVE